MPRFAPIAVMFTALLLSLPASAEEDDLPPARRGGEQKEPQPPPKNPMNLYSLLTPEDLTGELERRHLEGGSFAELIERVTRGLVAAPYILSPLGEGEMPDPDPRFRVDAFDCTTFVETALALSRCDELDQIQRVLDTIRYSRKDTRFTRRRHLMTAQWVPQLIEAGFLEDITVKVAKRQTKWISLEMTKKRWKGRKIARDLDLPVAVVPMGTFKLPYIPIRDMVDFMDRIPPGTIINILRSDIPTSPEVVTHQGLIIMRPGDKTRYVRHASPVSKRVIDESLEHMIGRYIRPRTPRKWPIIGVNLLAIVEPKTAESGD